jgi:hypothetical protein
MLHRARQGCRLTCWGIFLLATCALVRAAYDDYASAKQKIDSIQADKLRPGTRVTLSYPELIAYVRKEAPDGLTNPTLTVTAPGVATGSALVDFGKLERDRGAAPGWITSKFLDGERPVSITARIRASNGTATVDLDRVEISGMVVDGRTLDFLLRYFVVPFYPDAVIGKPFKLDHNIDQVTVTPSAVTVAIGGK